MARGQYTAIGKDRDYERHGRHEREREWGWSQQPWQQPWQSWQQPWQQPSGWQSWQQPWQQSPGWQQPAYQAAPQYPGFQWVPGYGSMPGHWERVAASYGSNW